jgi:2-aminoadipate transaminase
VDARIDRLQRITAASPGVVVLAGGLPSDDLFPRKALARAFLSVLDEPQCAALQYGWPEGDRELRSWIAARLRARGAEVAADDVIVTSGAQQAVAIAVERLALRGTVAGVDRETYPAALDLLRSRGVTPDAGSEGVDWFYVMPGIANPRGDGLTPGRRAALLASGRPIIADEAYAELRFDGEVPRPLFADARDRTWHVGTFSKTLCPGLRVGWLVPPPAERAAALAAKRARDLQAGTLAQSIVRAFLRDDDFDARLDRARAFYEARAGRLACALRRCLPSWRFRDAEGGFSLFVETDLDGDDARLLACAARPGVAFDPGSLFHAQPEPGPITLRVCFSTVAPDALDEAAVRLERTARAFRRGGARRVA